MGKNKKDCHTIIELLHKPVSKFINLLEKTYPWESMRNLSSYTFSTGVYDPVLSSDQGAGSWGFYPFLSISKV